MTGEDLHNADSPHVAGPGALLHSAREAARLTAEDVAKRLRLGVAIIRALEADDYSGISNPSFTRGYLRNYARLVGVSERRVLDECDRRGLHAAQPDVKPAHRTRAQARSSDLPVRWATYLIVSSIIAAPLVWWWQAKMPVDGAQETAPRHVMSTEPPGPPFVPGDEVPAPEQGAPADAEEVELTGSAVSADVTEAPAGGGVAPVEESSAPEAVAAAVPEATATAPADSTAAEPTAGTTEPQSQAVAQSASAPVQPPPPVPGLNRLTLTFTEACWVEILDGEGQRLLSGTIPAGATRTLESKIFQVRLGNSKGVEVRYNGEPFDQSRFAPRNIARFKLGDS